MATAHSNDQLSMTSRVSVNFVYKQIIRLTSELFDWQFCDNYWRYKT